MSQCRYCYAPTGDGGLCATDTTTLEFLLEREDVESGEMALLDVLRELDASAARQTAYGDGQITQSKSAETPLPVDLRAGRLAGEIRNALTTWARHSGADAIPGRLAEARRDVEETEQLLLQHWDDETGQLDAAGMMLWAELPRYRQIRRSYAIQDWLLSRGTAGVVEWLSAKMAGIRQSETAGEILRNLTALHERALKVIDRPAERIPLGQCGGERTIPDGGTIRCDRALYFHKGDLQVKCPLCRTVHDVDTALKSSLHSIEHIRGTVPRLVEIFRAKGQDITGAMIYGYAKRHAIEPVHTDHDRHHWYRLGDVLAAYERAQAVTSLPAQRDVEEQEPADTLTHSAA